MAFEPSVPSATNTFVPVPNQEGTAGLVVNFSRNPKSFGLPNWASYTPVSKWTGLYLRMNIDQCARILDAKGNNNKWARGQDAPELTWNLESFAWQPFITERYAYGYQLPREAEQWADFSVVSQQNAVEAQRAMTQRTQIAATLALTAGEYDANHVATATVWGGGYLGSGTATDPIFKRALETMYRRIHLDTRGTVQQSDMVVVLNPQLAHVISQGAEIHSYLQQSPYALPQMVGGEPGQNNNWGLPQSYANFRLVIEDAVSNPNAKGAASQAGQYIWPYHTLAMFARPGGLVAPEGAMSFSTVHVFLLEDMAVEQFDDPVNRRTTSRIVDDFGTKIVAPVSGCLCTEALASEPISFVPPGGDAPLTGNYVPQGVGIPQGSLQELDRRISQLSDLLTHLREENFQLRQENVALREQNPEKPAQVATTPAPTEEQTEADKRRGRKS